jgi:hypothetical protein
VRRSVVTLKDTKRKIESVPDEWRPHVMSFVESFRRNKNLQAIKEPFDLGDQKIDALLASTAEYLCDEIGSEPPAWLDRVPAPKDPWFVDGVDSLMAKAIVESPVRFRMRKIFVLENFLSRV